MNGNKKTGSNGFEGFLTKSENKSETDKYFEIQGKTRTARMDLEGWQTTKLSNNNLKLQCLLLGLLWPFFSIFCICIMWKYFVLNSSPFNITSLTELDIWFHICRASLIENAANELLEVNNRLLCTLYSVCLNYGWILQHSGL